MTYEDAVARLYQSAPDAFVAERKRLAAELKAGGDKAGAKQLEKLPRPSLSVWAVNQLWWQQRRGFEQLFERAARLRSGDLDATHGHREALAELRARAAELLGAGSHAVTDAVLRRVANTLSALAAKGSFDPDPPGALAADRDPPGFEIGPPAAPFAGAAKTKPAAQTSADDAAERERIAREQRRVTREQQRVAQEQRIAAERARARAEREKLAGELQRARGAVEMHAREVARMRDALAAAEQTLERARTTAADLEARLASSSDADEGADGSSS